MIIKKKGICVASTITLRVKSEIQQYLTDNMCEHKRAAEPGSLNFFGRAHNNTTFCAKPYAAIWMTITVFGRNK